MIGMMFNADVVLRSSMGIRRDSVVVFVAIYDVREQRYSRSVRKTVARADAASLPGALAPAIGAWLDERLESRRASPGFTLPEGSRAAFDSSVRHLRDSQRKRPPHP